MEDLIRHLLLRKKEAVGDKFEAALERAWSKRSPKDEKVRSVPPIERMSLGDLLWANNCWNSEYEGEEQIGDEFLVRQLLGLQKSRFRDFRDGFAHGAADAASVIGRHIKKKKDVKRMLRSMDQALQILAQEDRYRATSGT